MLSFLPILKMAFPPFNIHSYASSNVKITKEPIYLFTSEKYPARRAFSGLGYLHPLVQSLSVFKPVQHPFAVVLEGWPYVAHQIYISEEALRSIKCVCNDTLS